MLQNLRRYFYDNKTKILRNVLIVALCILAIRGINYLVQVNETVGNKVSINNEFTYGNLIDFSNTVNKNNSVIVNENLNQNEIISNNTINNNIVGENSGSSSNTGNSEGNYTENPVDTNIKNNESKLSSFLDICIEGNVEQAYEMISDECKNVLFPTLEKFEKNYYSNIFRNNMEYTIEKYYGNTYKVRVAEDMNTTGSYTTLAYTDYVTVRNQNGEVKVSVGNYIGRFNINQTTTNDNVTVKVNYKDVFMEYESYNVTVKNENEKIIKLNGNSTDTMYLTDYNGNKYYAYIHELLGSSLILRSGSAVDFNIKYDSSYSEHTNTKKELVFSNIILDYDTYRKLDDKSQYNDIGKVHVEL